MFVFIGQILVIVHILFAIAAFGPLFAYLPWTSWARRNPKSLAYTFGAQLFILNR